MSDQAPDHGPRAPAQDGFHRFVFYRELAEVYLLLDNVSASTSKSLPPSLTSNPGTPPEPDWIEAICAIGWPPQGAADDLAHQAATLLRARDRLNILAAPATGATIAFTLLVAGEDKGVIGAPGAAGLLPEARGPAARGWSGAAPSRYSLATIAFPSLKKPAADFRTFKWWMILGLLVWFIATSVLSWNIAAGNALLGQLASIEKTIAAAQNTAPFSRHAARQAASPAQPTPQPTPVAAPQPAPCAPGSACAEQAQNLATAQQNLTRWLGGWSILDWASSAPGTGVCPGGDPTACPPVNEQWASALLIVLGGNVLPIFYGVLGAGAAVVRTLSSRIKDSLLAPRHKTLFLVQLVLGAVIGGCIGLFVTPPGASASTTPGLLGSVPLSASALCFIAGFGVDGAFIALQRLISRIFDIPDPTKPASAAP